MIIFNFTVEMASFIRKYTVAAHITCSERKIFVGS
jgi:hypothetical protein